MPGSHARLAPSAAHRWMNCPGSIELTSDLPETSSDAADEGTILHAQIAGLLPYVRETRKTTFPHLVGRNVGVPGVRKLILLDDENVAALESCAECFLEESGGAPRTLCMIEQAVKIPGRDDVKGTSDVLIVDRPLRRLSVIDWKFGRGVRVFAEKNEQAIIYGLGALTALDVIEDIDTVRIVIHQPRMNHHDVWQISADELRGYLPRILESAAKTDAKGAALNDGDWCRFCGAAAACPRLRATALAAARAEFSVIEDLRRASPAQLAEAMAAIDRVESWCRAIEAETLARLTRGEKVDGWKLVEGRRSRDFADELTAHAFALSLGEDGFTRPQIKSPAQIEAAAKRRKIPVPDGLFLWSPGSPHIAPESDERPGTTSARLEFTKIEDDL